ncbi:MAG: hypothetical protein U1E27_07020 [Kiritimatiellia bacterium]|nr:hypothetical protein [Kiritimatiellia bacterium]
MKNRLKECLRIQSKESDRVTGEWCFPESFIGFQGHFPDRPILPGVCLVQAVLVLWESAQGGLFDLESLVIAKFLEPVRPGETLRMECEGNGPMLRALVWREETRVAEIRLQVKRA